MISFMRDIEPRLYALVPCGYGKYYFRVLNFLRWCLSGGRLHRNLREILKL